MIRPFGLRDAWAVRRLQPRGIALDFRYHLLNAPSPVGLAILGYLTRHHLGAFTFIHYGAERSGACGFAQFAPRADRQTWDLIYLAPSLDEPGVPLSLWEDLLSYAVLTGARNRVLRLCARLPQDYGAEGALRRAGFSQVMGEDIFILSERQPLTTMPPGLRRVDVEDRWALRELCRKAVPPMVYQAYGEMPPLASSMFRGTCQSYVWMEQGEAVAYLVLSSGACGYWIDCVVHPDRRGDLLPCIRYLVGLTDCSTIRPVYFAVPDYNAGLGWLLRMLGFDLLSRQVVMVAHVASRVTIQWPTAVPHLDGTIEIVSSASMSRSINARY